MDQFMQDYDQITNTGRRPRSRELDMMNLLLIGSMNKGEKRSGLEGIDQFLSPPSQQQNSMARLGAQLMGSPNNPFDPISRAQKSAPILPLPRMHTQDSLSQFAQSNFGIGAPPNYPFGPPPGQTFGLPPGMPNGMPPGMPLGMPPNMPLGMPPNMPLGMPPNMPPGPMMNPQFSMNGPPPGPPPFSRMNGPSPMNGPQFTPDFNPSISPPTNQKLLINGQMGVNVQQNVQQAQELQEKPNTRIIDYIQRQNEVLEKLTKNMASQREQEMKEEKLTLLEKMKKLEAQNAQDAFYNDMYDEVPPHVRQNQQFRPPPGYQYQPYYQQQNLYQQQFPSVPYPQKAKSKQQTLQMLRMLKQIKLANQNKKTKKKKINMEEIINDEAEMDSYTSQESDPEPRVVQKPRILKPRPIPPPPPYDPLEDEKKLEKLKRQRGMWNLRRKFRLLSYFIWRISTLRKGILRKKQETITKGPEMMQKFMDDTHGLYTRVLKNVIDQLINPKTNIQIVPKPKQKISPNQMKQNILKLKELVKQLFDGVTDNASDTDITENMIIYLNSITQEYAYLLDFQHVKLELSRLNFSYHGSAVNMNQNKQFMMIVIAVIVKVLLYRLLSKIHIAIPGVKVTDQLKTNVKTLVSVVYEIFMLFIRGFTAVQPDNTKYLPLENVVKEKKELYYTIETFDATEEEIAKIEEAKQKNNSKDERIDEPILFPIYNNREMAAFFDSERLFVNTTQQMVEGWCEKVNSILLNIRNEAENKRKEQVRLQKEQENKIMGIKRDQVNKLLKNRIEQYQQICQDIEDMKEKIIENAERAQQAKEEYEQMQQQRNERQKQMYGGQNALPNGRQF